LGTYDTESDAHQIVEEIKRLYKIGCTYYAMPESADINELEVI
jgi:radical SAM superfamily enzyme with C-terminal helix-hairpin-helix motif